MRRFCRLICPTTIATILTLLALPILPVSLPQHSPLGMSSANAAVLSTTQPAGDGVTVEAFAQRSKVKPGEQTVIAVKFEFQNHLHIWPNKPELPKGLEDFTPIPTVIALEEGFKLPAGIQVATASIQWPAAESITVNFTATPITIKSYGSTTIAYVPVLIAANQTPGTFTIPLEISWQACNLTSCFLPDSKVLTVGLEVVDAAATIDAAAPANVSLFGNFDASIYAELLAGSAPTTASPTAATSAGNAGPDSQDLGFGITATLTGPLAIVIGILGGMLLNLTPCVLPVIPIKILGLQHAAGSRRRMIFLGTMTAVGVVAFWLVIGSLIAFTTSLGAVSELVSLWWFNLGIAVFIAVMGAGMLGAFSVGLPNWIYAIQPKHDKASGSFFFGVMTAVLATPCVAPFGGAAAAWATKQSPLLTLVVFASIGLGMAIPYWLLAANPKWISFIPRAGPASEVVKQVLGMLLLAVAIFFAGTGLISLVFEFPHLALVLHWWAVCIAIALAALWLITRTFSITKSPARRGVFTLLSLTLAIASVWWANYQTDLQRASYAARGGDKTGSENNTGLWQDYSPEALAAAQGSGKTVVLNFTAEWCLTCKVLESAVLNTDAVQAALRGPNVVAMEADLTSRKAIGWAKLRELKEAGIPLLVVWRPGAAGPWISNAYTIDQVISNVTGK